MMKDTEFFQKALGLDKPWEIQEVKMEIESKRVEVTVGVQSGTQWAEDGKMLQIRGYEQRSWRHLDTMQFETIIRARVPRVEYEDGRTEVVKVPWAQRYSRLTDMMEAFVIRVLQSSASISKAASLLGLSWDTVNSVMKRAVERGLLRRETQEIKYLGIDEKGIGRGHHYATMLNDVENNRVWEVVEHRDDQATNKIFSTLSQQQREHVEAVAMDMWPAFMKGATTHLPNAKIVHDKFHVSAHLNKAVDLVRRAEHKQLKAKGDERLKGSKYQWLRGFEDFRSSQAREFRELQAANLKTARAWSLKESFSGFWTYTYPGCAEKFFKAWKKSALLSRLEPIRKVAKMLAKHLEGLLTYCSHPITNSISESFNSRIAAISANARGFRNFESLRIRILFYCGKLDLAL